MNIITKYFSAATSPTDCAVVFCYNNAVLTDDAQSLNVVSGKVIDSVIAREKFTGKPGQSLLFPTLNHVTAERVLLIGLGDKNADNEVTAENFRKALQKIPSALSSTTCTEITVCLDDIKVKDRSLNWQAQQLAEIIITSQHRSDGLKSKPAEPTLVLQTVIIGTRDGNLHFVDGIKQGQAIANGVNFARSLGNLPGNICTPTYLANEALRLTSEHLSVKVLDEDEMRSLGMGSLLSVSAGSDQPAKLIVLEYKNGNPDDAPIALVGKGITFDSGGISLKPGSAMDEMKFDMCGAASVLGTFKTILELQLPINVVGVIAASENMPNGNATKPGDIVTSMSGQTIEILNTDAEGRLVLCDALTYTERFNPKVVIDIATLTGAIVVALGSHVSGLYSNNDALSEALVAAGKQANDRAWPMPMYDEYQSLLDSNFADIANIGSGGPGSITAACFLSRFAKKFPWAHLDVAGTASKGGGAKGATGRPVPLLVQYLLTANGL